MNIYGDFSAFICSPMYFSVTDKASVIYCMIFLFLPIQLIVLLMRFLQRC